MIELELFALKYETNFNNKTYIIEAIDYYESDETKWLITLDGNQLTKDYLFVHEANKYNDIAFNTKDEAIDYLKTYLIIEEKIEQNISQYKEEIILLKNRLELSFLYDMKDTSSLSGEFLSVHDIEAALNKKGCFRINKSNKDCNGVQVSVTYIHNMFLLEKVIDDIAKENNCKVINIYNHDVPHCNYSNPLYYYWPCGNDYIRQFALLKHIF